MTLLLSLLFACQGDTESGFSTYGNSSIDTDSLTEPVVGDGESSSGDVNPVVSGMDGYFVADSNGIALEMHIYVTTHKMTCWTVCSATIRGESAESTELDIDGETVLVEEGELTFFILDIDETSTYDVSVTVYDEASNPSETYSTQVTPSEWELDGEGSRQVFVLGEDIPLFFHWYSLMFWAEDGAPMNICPNRLITCIQYEEVGFGEVFDGCK